MSTRIGRSAARARRRISPALRGGLHRGADALSTLRRGHESGEQLIRAVAAGGALLVMLLRGRNGAGAGLAGYQRDRASAEQLIRDLAALGTLLTAVLGRARTREPVGGQRDRPSAQPTGDPADGRPTESLISIDKRNIVAAN